MKSIATALFFSVIMVVKKAFALFAYPFAYAVKDWVYGNDVIKNYTMPKGVQESFIKWLFWIWLDDDQPNGYPDWYAKELIGYEPVTAWDKFRCAYAWSAWRNSAYNVNYYYFGNQSEIVSHKKWFGEYEWNRKLRASNGDNGAQFVWMTRANGRTTYLFSVAIQELYKGKMLLFKRVDKWYKIKLYIDEVTIPFTFYYGWNADTNGRFSVAMKFK